ncbi:hypothetical protein D3C76_829500 [compost metagenome]
MVTIQLLSLALSLQGAALRADAETRSIKLLTTDFHRGTFRRLLAKVNLTEGHTVDKLKAERKCLFVDHKSLTYRIWRAIHQRLPYIKATLALI